MVQKEAEALESHHHRAVIVDASGIYCATVHSYRYCVLYHRRPILLANEHIH